MKQSRALSLPSLSRPSWLYPSGTHYSSQTAQWFSNGYARVMPIQGVRGHTCGPLSPEYDEEIGLNTQIWGRLRHADWLEADTTHPRPSAPDHQTDEWSLYIGLLESLDTDAFLLPLGGSLPDMAQDLDSGHPLRAPWSRQPSDQRTADLWPSLFKEPKPMGLRLSSYYYTLFTTTCMYLYLTYGHKSIYWVTCMGY